MKKILTIIFTLAFGLTFIFAQKGHKIDKKKVEEFLDKKIEYIVKETDLTAEEKSKFIPLYKQYENEKFKMFRETPIEKFKKEEASLTEDDYKERNEMFINERVNRAILDRVYYERFKEFLSEKKINKLYIAERNYKRVLMKELEEKGKKTKMIKNNTENIN